MGVVIILAVVCLGQAPPFYAGVNTSSTQLSGTLTPPFGATSAINSTAYGPLNPKSNINSLLTTPAWHGPTSGINATTLSNSGLTSSSGMNDIMWSVQGTYLGVHLEGTTCILRIAYDPATNAAQNVTAGDGNPRVCIAGPFGFSKLTDNTFYYLKGNHYLQSCTIANDSAYSCTPTFDFDTCPAVAVTPGVNAQAGSILGISANDSVFTADISWTGGQGTSHQVFAYAPGKGCAELDLSPLGTASTFGNTYAYGATIPQRETVCYDPQAAMGQGVHDTQIFASGALLITSGACFNTGPGNGAVWEIGTANVLELDPYTDKNTGGHDSAGVNSIIYANNPNPTVHSTNPLNATEAVDRTPACHIPNMGDGHGFWPHPFLSDGMPWILELRSAQGGNTPAAYQNEIVGCQVYASGLPVLRFGETWNSGTSGGGSCSTGIGAVDQSGTHIAFMTDMLGNMGKDSKGNTLCVLVAKVL